MAAEITLVHTIHDKQQPIEFLRDEQFEDDHVLAC